LLGSSVQRRIPIKKIVKISLSTMMDNYFILHVENEYDYILISNNKTEIVTVLSALYKDLTENVLNVTFADKFQYKIETGKMRDIEFQKDENAKEAKFKRSGENLIVLTATGLPKGSGRKRKEPVKVSKMQINLTGKGNKQSTAQFTAVAIYDYTAKNARELSFKAGETIQVSKKDPTGLWHGECRGKRGVFPATHVQLKGL